MYMRERFYDVLPPMGDAISIDATQAARWWLRDDEKDSYPWANYHCVVPPHHSTWMEFEYPSEVRENGILRRVPSGMRSLGVHFLTVEIDNDTAETVRGKHNAFISTALSRYAPGISLRHNGDFTDSDILPKWLVIAHTFLGGKRTAALVCLSGMTLDENGKFLRYVALPIPWSINVAVTGATVEAASAAYHALPKHQQQQISEALQNEWQNPFMFCLSLLHCRNVEVVDAPAPPAPILKQRAKKGIPYIQYKTLEVKPLRKVYRNGERQNGEAEPKALHFVRGHFKDFTAKGLFGKYKGVYWWDSVVRGDASKGIIDKDYKLSNE